MAFHFVDENLGGLLAYTLAALLDGGEHGVAGNGTLSVGESADAHVLRHTKPSVLHGVENADGGVVVDGEVAVRRGVKCHEVGGNQLGVGTVVAYADDGFIYLHTVFQQGVFIAVVTVLGNLQLHGTAVVSYTLAAYLDEVAHRIVGTHVVIYHHATGVDTRANTVVEHDGDVRVDEFLEVLVVVRVLGLGHDDATHLLPMEHLADTYLALIHLVAQCHHDVIATRHGRLFNTRQDAGEIVVGKLRHDDANDLRRHDASMAQSLADGIRIKVVFASILLDDFTPFLADAWRIFQCTRHSGHADAKLACDVFHCHRCLVRTHSLSF